MNKLLQTTALGAMVAMAGATYADNLSNNATQNTGQTMQNATTQMNGQPDSQAQSDAMDAGSEDSNMAAKDSKKDMYQDAATRDSAATFVQYDDIQANEAMRASNLIGMRVYAAQKDVDENSYYNEESRRDWENIGEINDVIIGWNGQVEGVILGVGGFLGMGEKNFGVDMSSLRRVRESSDSNDWFLVVNSTRQALENAPSYRPAS